MTSGTPKETGFDAVDLPLKDVLFSSEKYMVPRFQRQYTWGTDHVSDFWTDVSGGDDDYFIGTLIMNYERYKQDRTVEIIDGQQRLLTLTVLMAILRNGAIDLGEKDLAHRIQARTIAVEDLASGKQTYRIVCGDTTKEFFEKYIQNEDSGHSISGLDEIDLSREEILIKKCYVELKGRVDEELANQQSPLTKKNWLQETVEKISDLRIIRISINNEDKAYDIFETVNARGKELSVADLLKSLIFRNIRATAGGEDEAKSLWGQIQENVEDADVPVTKFIRYYWLSKHEFVTESRLFRSIKNDVKDYPGFLREVANESEIFKRIVAGSQQDWTGTKHGLRILDSLTGIRIMRATQCYVLFLNMFSNLEKLVFDPYLMVKTVENFTFNYFAVCKQPGNRVERLYSRTALKIEDVLKKSKPKDLTGDLQSVYSGLQNELRKLRPSRDEFIKQFMEISYKNSSEGRRFVGYVLERINRQNETGEHLINFDLVNTEHILPQKPNRFWGVDKAEAKKYVDKLGNLTLVLKELNSKASNSPPKDKARVLKESDIPMTQEVAKRLQRGSWGMAEIEERQIELAEQAYDKVWNF